MKRIRLLGLCLVAVFAISAVAAGSAAAAECAAVVEAGSGRYHDGRCTKLGGSKEYILVERRGIALTAETECAKVAEPGTGNWADPECATGDATNEYIKVFKLRPTFPKWQVCGQAAKANKSYTGAYNNNTCTEENAESKGKYELRKWNTAKDSFGSLSSKTVLYEYVPVGEPGEGIKGAVECAKGKDRGEITGEKSETLKITYSKCKEVGGFPCENGAGREKITTEQLYGELVWLNEEETKVGVALAAATPSTPLAVFHCGPAEVHVYGSLLGVPTPVNAGSKTITNTFAVDRETGEQEYQEIWAPRDPRPDYLVSEIGPPVNATLPSSEESIDVQKFDAYFYISTS